MQAIASALPLPSIAPPQVRPERRWMRSVPVAGDGEKPVLLVGAHVGLFQFGGSAVRQTVGANRLNVGAGSPKREKYMSVRETPERALFALVRGLKQPGFVGSLAAAAAGFALMRWAVSNLA